MTFYVNGIKQENETEHKVELLIDVEASLVARKILENHTILILSLKERTQDKHNFGDVYFTISFKGKSVDIITKYTDPQEACEFFQFIGFDIQRVNRRSIPISETQSQDIIFKAKQQASNKIESIEAKQKAEDEAERKVYADEKLESAKKIILQVFEKVDHSLKRADATIEFQEMKEIKALTEELKKLRMGTNFEKIRSTIQELFKVIDTVDDAYFASIQNSNVTIAPDSLVTMTDVDRELERMEKVKILKELHIKISIKNKDYASFGAGAIYRKFLQKDLLLKLSNMSGLLRSVYDIAELILLVVISLLGVYTLVNEIYLFSFNKFGLAYMLMSVGLRGMVIFAARYFRNRNIGRLLFIVAVAILLHYVLMRAVTTNFAL